MGPLVSQKKSEAAPKRVPKGAAGEGNAQVSGSQGEATTGGEIVIVNMSMSSTSALRKNANENSDEGYVELRRNATTEFPEAVDATSVGVVEGIQAGMRGIEKEYQHRIREKGHNTYILGKSAGKAVHVHIADLIAGDRAQDEEKRTLLNDTTIKIDESIGSVHVASHGPNRVQAPIKEKYVEAIIEVLDKLRKEYPILTIFTSGDFNQPPKNFAKALQKKGSSTRVVAGGMNGGELITSNKTKIKTGAIDYFMVTPPEGKTARDILKDATFKVPANAKQVDPSNPNIIKKTENKYLIYLDVTPVNMQTKMVVQGSPVSDHVPMALAVKKENVIGIPPKPLLELEGLGSDSGSSGSWSDRQAGMQVQIGTNLPQNAQPPRITLPTAGSRTVAAVLPPTYTGHRCGDAGGTTKAGRYCGNRTKTGKCYHHNK